MMMSTMMSMMTSTMTAAIVITQVRKTIAMIMLLEDVQAVAPEIQSAEEDHLMEEVARLRVLLHWKPTFALEALVEVS
jgi:hypothetical protein